MEMIFNLFLMNLILVTASVTVDATDTTGDDRIEEIEKAVIKPAEVEGIQSKPLDLESYNSYFETTKAQISNLREINERILNWSEDFNTDVIEDVIEDAIEDVNTNKTLTNRTNKTLTNKVNKVMNILWNISSNSLIIIEGFKNRLLESADPSKYSEKVDGFNEIKNEILDFIGEDFRMETVEDYSERVEYNRRVKEIRMFLERLGNKQDECLDIINGSNQY